jgi:hypothetical protein
MNNEIIDSIYLKAEKTNHKDNTLKCALDKAKKDGIALEFGVFSGRTLGIISRDFPDKSYGFDSFLGLPEDWRPNFKKGLFATNKIPKIDKATIIVGLFQETLLDFLNEELNISFVHFDADLYSSTKYVLDSIESYLGETCVFLFDEFFNYETWQDHEFKAFSEFLDTYSWEYEPIAYSSNNSQIHNEQVAFKVTRKS